MKDANTNLHIVDASYVLSFLLVDEGTKEVDDFFRSYVDGTIRLLSSEILSLEVLNALLAAHARKRISEKQVKELSEKFWALAIPLERSGDANCLTVAFKYSLTAYDASYLVLAKRSGAILHTHDKALKKVLSK